MSAPANSGTTTWSAPAFLSLLTKSKRSDLAYTFNLEFSSLAVNITNKFCSVLGITVMSPFAFFTAVYAAFFHTVAYEKNGWRLGMGCFV